MIPSSRALWSMGILFALSLAATLWAGLLGLWLALLGLVTLLVLVDGVRALRAPPPQVERIVPEGMQLYRGHGIALTVRTQSTQPQRIRIQEHAPQHCLIEGMPMETLVAPEETQTLYYRLVPRKRGTLVLAGVETLSHSPWGFWWRRGLLPCRDAICVYPAATQITNAKDSVRNAPVAPERRRLLIVLDCGHTMGVVEASQQDDEAAGFFGRTLGAVLGLCQLALSRGDRVGLVTAGKECRWVWPQPGRDGWISIMNATLTLQPEMAVADLAGALRQISERETPDTAVLMCTNVIDEVDDTILELLTGLQQRGQPLFWLNVQEELRTTPEQIKRVRDALRVAASYRYSDERRQLAGTLQRRGITYSDHDVGALPRGMLQAYTQLMGTAPKLGVSDLSDTRL